ncbi:hypothetical protein CARUB_v10010824mg, partial [Capsella rubella]
MTELGHGTNVRGSETVTTYDARTREFVNLLRSIGSNAFISLEEDPSLLRYGTYLSRDNVGD